MLRRLAKFSIIVILLVISLLVATQLLQKFLLSDEVNKWLNERQTLITILISLVTMIISPILFLFWDRSVFPRDKNKVSKLLDEIPFEIIPPTSKERIKEVLYRHDLDALTVPYQRDGRIGVEDVEGALVEQLHQHRCIVIRGQSGIGKTRELLRLAEHESSNGWTVMVYKGGLMGRPSSWNDTLPRKRILIIFDDIHHYCDPEIHPDHELKDGVNLSRFSYRFQDELNSFLNFMEAPALNDIHVVCTARSENVHWNKLNFDSHAVWKRFSISQMHSLDSHTLSNLLETYASSHNITVEDAIDLVDKSDGTPQTVVMNVQRAVRSSESSINTNNWTNAAHQSWEELYRNISREIPWTPFIYDAAFILKELNISIYPFMLKKLASQLATSKWLRRILIQPSIGKSITDIQSNFPSWGTDGDIIELREGMLEAKSDLPNPSEYLPSVASIILFWSRLQKKLLPAVGELAVISLVDHPKHTIAAANILIHNGLNIAFGLRGMAVYIRERNYDASIIDLTKVIELFPDDDFHLSLRGQLHLENGYFEKAVDDFSRALDLAPDQAEYLALRAEAYRRLGEFNFAREDLKRANNVDFELAKNILGTEGLISLDEGDFAGALRIFTEYINFAPDDPAGYQNRGLVYQELGALHKALKDVNDLIQREPDEYINYLFRGNTLFDLDRYDEAEADFRKVIEHIPDNSEAYRLLGVIYSHRQQFEEANVFLRRAQELNPDDPAVLTDIGMLYLQQNDLESARIVYEQALELDTNSFIVRQNLATTYNQLEMPDSALEHISYIIDNFEVERRSYLQRAVTFFELGRIDSAIEDLVQIYEMDPLDSLAYLTEFNLNTSHPLYAASVADVDEKIATSENADDFHIRGIIHVLFGETEKAQHDFERALEINPSYTDSLKSKGLLHLQNGGFEEAIEDFSEVIERLPDDVASFQYRATCYEKLEEYQKAIDDYSELIALEPSNTAYWGYRGYLYRLAGEYDLAIADFNRVTQIDPSDPEAFAQRAYTLEEQGYPLKALEELNQAIDIAPYVVLYFVRRAIILSHLNDLSNAIADINEARELDFQNYLYPFLSAVYKTQMNDYSGAIEDLTATLKLNPDFKDPYLLRGLLNIQAKRFQNAKEDLVRASEIQHSRESTLKYLGLLQSFQKDFESAIEYLSTAIDEGTEDAEIYHTRGVIHSIHNEHSKALEDFQKAVSLKPEDQEYLVDLGTSYYEIGNYEEAYTAFTTAKSLGIDFEEYHEVYALISRIVDELDSALESLEITLDKQPNNVQALIGVTSVYKAKGDIEQYEFYSARLRNAIQDKNNREFYNIACGEAVLGNINAAINALRLAVGTDGFDKEWAKVDPDLRNLHDDERFKTILSSQP